MSQPQHASESLSPYKRIGGAPTIKRMVDILYGYITMDDRLYLRFFADKDVPAIKHHMFALLSDLLGREPKLYTGRDLIAAHEGLPITNDDHDRVGDYVMSALYAVHAAPDIIAAVADILEGVRPGLVKA